jgi:hypothetical protein
VPLQCDPGKGKHPAGAECLANDDCASGACDGARIQVSDPALLDGGAGPCAPTYPDAGAGCHFGPVLGGHCR